jgi:hypothetical protein
MKYIRTKDGKIFEIEKDLGRYGISKTTFICDFDGNFIDVEKRDMTLKEADTIEELLDERVIIDALGYHIIVKTELEEIYWKQHDVECVKCYGAIWTDKGLIYVAKMNDEGKLELL